MHVESIAEGVKIILPKVSIEPELVRGMNLILIVAIGLICLVYLHYITNSDSRAKNITLKLIGFIAVAFFVVTGIFSILPSNVSKKGLKENYISKNQELVDELESVVIKTTNNIQKLNDEDLFEITINPEITNTTGKVKYQLISIATKSDMLLDRIADSIIGHPTEVKEITWGIKDIPKEKYLTYIEAFAINQGGRYLVAETNNGKTITLKISRKSLIKDEIDLNKALAGYFLKKSNLEDVEIYSKKYIGINKNNNTN